MDPLQTLKDKILAGGQLTDDEVYSLCDVPSVPLREAAAEITRALCTREFDSCSIVNARSGSCSENCRWCAQSAHYDTGCTTYETVGREECLRHARLNSAAGIKRFSLVASGRAVRGRALDRITALLREVGDECGMSTCASLGLLDPGELRRLWDSGARRYHCNLETAPSYFATLCTTHTVADKLATIAAAREIGFEICSGGIIGMGETRRQRAEFALALREARPVSIPINILSPIKGTPLQDTPPVTDDEILDTVAIFRLAHPRVVLRFAGGRARLSRQVQLEAMRIGINGCIMGDLLTTVGSTVADDKRLISEAGYEF